MNLKPFKEKILECYDLEELKEIAEHGCANCAPGGLIYYHETAKAYDLYEEEIWDLVNEQATEMGYRSSLDFICTLKESNKIESSYTFKNLLVWFYVEHVAECHLQELEEKSYQSTQVN